MVKRLGQYLLAVLLIAVLGIAAYWLYQTQFSQSASAQGVDGTFTQIIPVQVGDISASISVVGEVYAVQQEDLRFDLMDGRAPLLDLSVEPGYVVEAGEALATIDSEPYQQALDQALSDLQAEEEALADLQTPATELEIAQVDLAIVRAGLDLQQAQENLEDLQNPDITDLQDALDNAQNALTLARLQQTLAQHDSIAKSERDLLYAADWYARLYYELEDLAAQGNANKEQTEEMDEAAENEAATRAELALVQVKLQATLNVAEAGVVAAVAAVADAEETLLEAQDGPDELALARAQLAVAEAEVSLTEARERRADLETGADPVGLAAAQARVDKMRLAVADVEDALAGTTLRAPFSGTVLDSRVNPGDLISADMRILTLADLSELEVLASVDETMIRQVQAGQQAVITFGAFPNQQLKGHVLSVPLQGTLQGDVMIYQVSVSFDNTADLPLLVGMTANVNIMAGQAEDVLLVPAMAVQTGSGFYQVMVADQNNLDAAPMAVPVEIGLSDGVNTEIVRGLNQSDLVVVQMQAVESGFSGFGAALRSFGGGRPPGR